MDILAAQQRQGYPLNTERYETSQIASITSERSEEEYIYDDESTV